MKLGGPPSHATHPPCMTHIHGSRLATQDPEQTSSDGDQYSDSLQTCQGACRAASGHTTNGGQHGRVASRYRQPVYANAHSPAKAHGYPKVGASLQWSARERPRGTLTTPVRWESKKSRRGTFYACRGVRVTCYIVWPLARTLAATASRAVRASSAIRPPARRPQPPRRSSLGTQQGLHGE